MLASLTPQALTLLLMCCFLVKHAIADYVLQTSYMFCNKGRYLHPGGLLHAGFHALLTAPILIFIAPTIATTAGTMLIAKILVAEFLIHYHIDWAKEQIGRRCDLSP